MAHMITYSKKWVKRSLIAALAILPLSIETAIASMDSPNSYRSWASFRDLTEADYEKKLEDYKKSGMRPIDVEVLGGNKRTYAVVFRKNSENLAWEVRTKLSDKAFSDKWKAMRESGYRLIDQETHVYKGKRYFGGIWIKNKAGLKWASIRKTTSDGMHNKYKEYKAAGLAPIDIDAYAYGNGVRYSSIWVQKTDVTSWIFRRNLSSATFGKEYKENDKKGYRLIDSESYRRNGKQQYAAIWVKDKKPRKWVGRRDMSSTGFHNWWATFRDSGYRIEDIEMYDTPDGRRYAGVWTENATSKNGRGLSSKKNAGVDCAINSYLARTPSMGFSVAVAHKGKAVFLKGYGWADKENSKKAHSGTIYRTASVAKAITGTLGFILDDKGTIDIDKRVDDSEYLSNLPNQHTYRMRRLLSNRSKMRHYCCAADATSCDEVSGGNMVCVDPDPVNSAGAVSSAWAATQLFMNDPLVDGNYNYSTHAYTVFAAAIEAKTGGTFCSRVKTEIADAHGLSTLRCENRDNANYERAALYQLDGSKLESVDADDLSWKFAGGGMEISARDLMRLGVKLDQRKILDETPLQDMLTRPNSLANYAHGWEVRGSHDGLSFYGKNGDQTGSRAYIRVYPDEDLVIALLGNTRGGGYRDLATEIARIILSQEPATVIMNVKTQGSLCPKQVTATGFANFPYSKCYQPSADMRFILNGTSSGYKKHLAQKRKIGSLLSVYQTKAVKGYMLGAGTHKIEVEARYDSGTKKAEKSVSISCPIPKVTPSLKVSVEKKDTCKKMVTAKVRFTSNVPKTIQYRIRDKNGKILASGVTQTNKVGNKYVAKATKKFKMGAYKGRLRLEPQNLPGTLSNKTLNIKCLKPVKGKVTLRSIGGANSCKAEALVAIHTNIPGKLPYELECGVGKSWQRDVKAPANKIGVDKVQFTAKHNERVVCILRTRIDGKITPLSGTNKRFKCSSVTGVTTTNGIQCLGGRVVKKRCVCPSNKILKRIKKGVFQCAPRPLGTAVKCVGGKVIRGKCICPKGRKLIRGMCVKPAG